MIKFNSIGNKLGLAGAIGVLLAVGMVANQMMTESRVAGVNDRADRAQRVTEGALAAHADLRQVQLAGRNLRLARTTSRYRQEPGRHAQGRQGRRKRNRCCLCRGAAAGKPGTAAEDQVADDELRCRHRGTRHRPTQPAGAGREAQRHLGRVDQGDPAGAELEDPGAVRRLRRHAEPDAPGRHQDERLAGVDLAVRRHRRDRHPAADRPDQVGARRTPEPDQGTG